MKKLFGLLSRIADISKKVAVTLLVLLLLVEVGALVVFSRPHIPEQAILLINPVGTLVEQVREPGGDGFLPRLPDPDQTRLRDIIRALQYAADDPRILAVRLDLEDLQQVSLAKVADVVRALREFRQSGKPVWVAQYNYTQAQYLIASAADQLWLQSMGNVFLGGIGVYRNYIRDALDKLDVDVHVFRVGKYKSALEPLMRNSMSEEDKQANAQWMNALWQQALQMIADNRGLKTARIQALLDHPARYLRQYDGSPAQLSLKEGLVDVLGEPQDLHAALSKHVGADSDLEELPFKEYLRAFSTKDQGKDEVAIITASGNIVAGEQPPGVVGGDTLANLLEQAADDERTKAIVLRVDSPGGSAQASEVIRHAIAKVQQQGKPVVVSMGSVAASGGYWIAAGADEIWAQPSTLTGSIGVFGALPNLTRALDKLGIHSDGLGTTRSAEGIRLDRPLSAELQAVVQMNVEHIYRQFLHVVATGRDIPEAQVNEIAQGRVWSGVDALRIGLVDYLGDLPQAVEAAARLAHIENDYQSYDLRPPKDWPSLVMDSLFGEARLWSASAVPSLFTWLGPQRLPLTQTLGSWMQLLNSEPGHVFAYSGLKVQ